MNYESRITKKIKKLANALFIRTSYFVLRDPHGGFTFIELLVVIGVVAILASGVLVAYRAASGGIELKTNAFKVVDVLNLARQRTIASLGSSEYGVHFEANQYVLFKGAAYSAPDSDNIFYALPDTLEIADVSLAGGGFETVFDRITGKTAQSGSLKVRLVSDIGKFKTINILSSGRADISSDTLAPAGTRVSDSRHTHFNYAQDVRSATTLTLNFPGYISQDIAFQDYLDAGKTVFDWSGTILVNGSNQVLRIHTHNLDASSADFSITRDSRYNNEALEISLGGQNLINYAINGAVTQGSSLWASIPVRQ